MDKHNKDIPIEEALKNRQSPAGMLDKESFWQEFKQQAAEVEQDAPEPAPIIAFPMLAKAAAIFVILGGIIFAVMFTTNHNGQPVNATAPAIEGYEIYVPHSAVLVLEDEKHSGTILWVAGVDSKPGGDM